MSSSPPFRADFACDRLCIACFVLSQLSTSAPLFVALEFLLIAPERATGCGFTICWTTALAPPEMGQSATAPIASWAAATVGMSEPSAGPDEADPPT
jgi:hypothetical protein